MRHLTIALALAAGLASADPAAAQEPTAEPPLADQISDISRQLLDKLRPLAQALGVSFPDVRDRMEPLIRAAVPTPPPAGADWAFDMSFDNTTSVTGDGAAPEEGRQSVFNDAQACIARFPDRGPVVHFRRIRQGGLRGHQCVLAGVAGDEAVLFSETYVEGPDRHLTARYTAAATVAGDAAATLALVDPVVETNIALAAAIAQLSLDGLPSARVRDGD
ncbi:hypothetical protein [Brevundimonas sp.]|uniref:hypothetical protein n=1 Tax=Brevundimonas sp. TaxID=1871086 RepID=UPI002FDA84DC